MLAIGLRRTSWMDRSCIHTCASSPRMDRRHHLRMGDVDVVRTLDDRCHCAWISACVCLSLALCTAWNLDFSPRPQWISRTTTSVGTARTDCCLCNRVVERCRHFRRLSMVQRRSTFDRVADNFTDRRLWWGRFCILSRRLRRWRCDRSSRLDLWCAHE